MHCSKAIFSSLYVNPLDVLSQSAMSVAATQKVFNGKFIKLVKQIQNISKKEKIVKDPELPSSCEKIEPQGAMSQVMETLRPRLQKEDPKDKNRGIERVPLMLKKSQEPPKSPTTPFPLYYLLIYFVARWVFYSKSSSSSSTAS